jgi:hypothetical protein
MVSKAFGLSRVADNDLTTFFVDSANNRVGVGTNSPSDTLQVTGTANVSSSLTVANNKISPFNLRNKIINGGMGIDQRNGGASQTFTAAAALAYSVDRWYGYCTGANVTGQRVAGSGQSQYRYQFTGAASVTAIGFGQRIEAINCYDLNNTTSTLSVDLANSVLTTVTWTAYYANTADTFGSLAVPTRTQIATGTFTVTSTVTRYTTNISIPSNATTGIEIVFTVGAQTSGTWTIGNVQLEAGTVSTPFEVRPFGTELALCQRYYQLGRGDCRAALNGNSQVGYHYPFPVTMRATASISLLSTAAGTPAIAFQRSDGFVFYGTSIENTATFSASAEL